MIEDKAASYLTNQAKRNAEAIKQFMIGRVNDIRLISSIWDISKININDHIGQIANDQHRPYVDFFIMTQSGQLVFSTREGKIDSKTLDMAACDTLS
ncbi:MAG TPA: histidine kinase, partial [Desulfobacter sp.]|nr:histidine kinase [Desulfobacter sp.]